MAVRRVRAERDELRRRDAKLRKQLNDARTTLKVWGSAGVHCPYEEKGATRTQQGRTEGAHDCAQAAPA